MAKDTIKSITRLKEVPEATYNVQVKDNKNYFAGGILVHNCDDPLSPRQAASEAELATANKFFDETLPTRKVDKEVTPTYLIMQRLAANDPTGHLLNKKGSQIHHICLPGTLSSSVKPEKYKQYYTFAKVPAGYRIGKKDHETTVGLLDATRLSVNILEDLHLDLGTLNYSGQIAQNPVPIGGLIWKKWFREIDDDIYPAMEQAEHLGTDWDTAYTEKEANAASAYVTAGKIDGKAFIWDLDFAYLEFPELVKYIRARKGPHYLESKASGSSAKQALTRAGIIAIEVKLMGGADKVARAKMATPPVEAGLVYIKKSLVDKLYNDERQGILNFPKNTHKDLADALSQSMQRLFSGGVVVGRAGTGSILDRIKQVQ